MTIPMRSSPTPPIFFLILLFMIKWTTVTWLVCPCDGHCSSLLLFPSSPTSFPPKIFYHNETLRYQTVSFLIFSLIHTPQILHDPFPGLVHLQLFFFPSLLSMYHTSFSLHISRCSSHIYTMQHPLVCLYILDAAIDTRFFLK
jgi:hypothetical protein